MEVIKTKIELRSYRSNLEGSIGFIPTMGNLHNGHLSLIEASLAQDDHTVVSIFVNPTQFGPGEDFDLYPRTLDEDLETLSNLSSKIIVFTPQDMTEVYPKGFSTTISLGEKTQILCGKTRPHHFDGVTTVVYKLFNLVQPHHAYFGEKDYQQFFLIKKMVLDLELNTRVIGLPIIRAKDNLALSSRNKNLKDNERDQALKLFYALTEVEKSLRSEGLKEAQKYCINFLMDNDFEYLEINNQEDLETFNPDLKDYIILGAVKIGKTRLIDNIKGSLET